jgi:beta-phosphoglucomutase-like phosphatase (HAD superfamily)
MKILNGEPRSSLVFEDSEAGITSGRRAGAWVVAITGTNHFDQDTELAHHHIEDLRGIDREWVRKISRELTT